ncbi:MAG: VWA domain-containing protein [Myxococcota bacterium]
MSIGSIWFQAPHFLWGLSLLLPLLALEAHTPWPAASRGRKLLGAGLRAGVVASVVVALAAPVVTLEREARDVIFVVDVSPSVDDAALERARADVDRMRGALGARTHAGLVVFDEHARVVTAPGEDWEQAVPLRQPRRDDGGLAGTNIAEALELAMGLMRQGAGGEVVLLTDARQTSGDLGAMLTRARAQHITVSTRAIGGGVERAAISGLEVSPSELRPGETMTGKFTLKGAEGELVGVATVRVDDEVVHTEQVKLAPGQEVEVRFTHALDAEEDEGALAVRVEVTPTHGGEVLKRLGSAVVLGPPRVLMVASERPEVEPMARVLKAEGMAPKIVTTEELHKEPPELKDVDLVILGNVPAAAPDWNPGMPAMPRAFVEGLRGYVSDGGGLLVLGGDKSYSLGGYGRTELRKFLPVELEPEEVESTRPVTMVIILDSSGSMGAYARGGRRTKMALTNEGAVAAMRLLRPALDRIAVMNVDTAVHWKVRPQAAAITQAMERSVRGVYAAGGGINVYTSLKAAREVLRDSPTSLKHVILFSDAADAAEQVKGIDYGWGPGPNSYTLARSMVEEGITISVIGVGRSNELHVSFLRKLAKEGAGRFHLTNDARLLKSLFVEETQQIVQRQIKEQSTGVRLKKRHEILEGISWSDAPELKGYVEVKPRPTAEVLLETKDGDPLMTTWQYGLGQVVAMSSDAGPRWSSRWMRWEGYEALWTQTARWALKRSEGQQTGAQVSFAGHRAKIELARRTSAGQTKDLGGLRAMLKAEGAQLWKPVELDVREPGLWHAQLDLDPNTTYILGVLDEDGEAVLKQRFATPSSLELQHATPDATLLRDIAARTGGEYDAARVMEQASGALSRVHPMWLVMMILAALLLPVDAFLRRP